jgi:hypothetical protein
MTWFELEEIIARVLGIKPREVEMVANEEWNNDTDHFYEKCHGALDEWDKKRIENNLSKKTYGQYDSLAWINYLVGINLLSAGNYWITVSW